MGELLVLEEDTAASPGGSLLGDAKNLACAGALGIFSNLPMFTPLCTAGYRVSGSSADLAMVRHLTLSEDLVGHLSQGVSWLSRSRKSLDSMGMLPDNWNGYGSVAPNRIALYYAAQILDVLAVMGFAPANVVPSADNGVGISFRKGERYALIESYNSGEMAAVLSLSAGLPEAWDVFPWTVKETLERIYEHIHGAHSG